MKKLQQYLPWGLLVAFLSVIYFLNRCFAFSSDDCWYGLSSVVCQDGIHLKLSNLGMVWQENIADGYRPVVHFFVRLFAGVLNKEWFNFVNTAMLGALIFLINRIAIKTWRLSFKTLPFLIALVFLILCKGESYLWCAGSVNYLWAGTLTLCFCLIRERIEVLPRLTWFIIPIMAISLFCGWVQEGFALPVLFALGLWNLVYIRKLSSSKVLVYGSYALGALVLCLVAGRRASTIAPFTVMGCILTQIKILVAIKAAWIVVLVFLFECNKREFIRRNLFELLVILGSYLMISIVGFNGERSLWCCNLFAIIIVIREFTPPKWLSTCCFVGLIPLCVLVLFYGIQIKSNFDLFLNKFLSSEDNVTCHERVDCGFCARFFHQVIYRWQSNDGHAKSLAEYYGRKDAPLALEKELYEKLYLQDNFCHEQNRLPIDDEFYTTPISSAIIMPLSDGESGQCSVDIQYDLPKDLVSRVRFEIAIRKNPPVANMKQTRVLISKSGKRYLLIPKYPECDQYIKKITLQPSHIEHDARERNGRRL